MGYILQAKLFQLRPAGDAGLLIPVAGRQELPLHRIAVDGEARVGARLLGWVAHQPAGDAPLGRVVPLAHVEGHAQVGDALADAAQLVMDAAGERLSQLVAGPTQSELAEAQGNVDTAAAALATAQAQPTDLLDGADVEDFDEAQLVTPFDGTVAALNVGVGEEVGGTSADWFRLVRAGC